MKKNLTLFIILCLVCILSKSATAEDIYLYYTTKDHKGRAIDTKIYSKDGNARMEIIIGMAGMEITTASLLLKDNPNEMIILNPLSKSYTKQLKPKKKPDLNNYSITVIGREKVSGYNCTRVRIKRDGKSFDMWCTKDIPMVNLAIENNQVTIDKKLEKELANKGVFGMMVKTVYTNPGTAMSTLTMELVKYETKPLSASLFKIPSDYKESKGNPYQNISPEKKKEMMKQMMEQLRKKTGK